MLGRWRLQGKDGILASTDETDDEKSVADSEPLPGDSAGRFVGDILIAALTGIESLLHPDNPQPVDPESAPDQLRTRAEQSLALLGERLSGQKAASRPQPDELAQVNTAMRELEEISTEQASFLEEANRSAGRMQSSIVENSRLAQKASEAATRFSTTTETRTEEILSIVSRLQASAEQATNSLSTIFDVGNSSNQIAKMAKTINDIAEQTKILALNAAIAAARAGEQGREFGVISSEIRQLATHTSDTAREITTVISMLETETRDAATAMQQVDVGLEDVDRAGDALRGIAAETGELVDAVDQICRHSNSQSAATSDVLFGIDAAAMTGEQLLEGVNRIGDLVGRLSETQAEFDSTGG